MLLVAFCFARSPSNEFWNAAYEIPDDVEVESQDGEVESQDGVVQGTDGGNGL